MNVALRRPMTVDDFLAWEERQELRYEFDGFRVLAMNGGTIRHSAIQMNLVRALGNRLQGSPCRVHGSHLKLRVDEHIRYPDAFVTCSAGVPTATWVSEPVVVLEILSESTAHEDMFKKNADYQATPSVQRYVILEQTHAAALVFCRKDGVWAGETVTGPGAVLAMPEIGIEVPLAEIYNDVGVEPDVDQSAVV